MVIRAREVYAKFKNLAKILVRTEELIVDRVCLKNVLWFKR